MCDATMHMHASSHGEGSFKNYIIKNKVFIPSNSFNILKILRPPHKKCICFCSCINKNGTYPPPTLIFSCVVDGSLCRMEHLRIAPAVSGGVGESE